MAAARFPSALTIASSTIGGLLLLLLLLLCCCCSRIISWRRRALRRLKKRLHALEETKAELTELLHDHDEVSFGPHAASPAAFAARELTERALEHELTERSGNEASVLPLELTASSAADDAFLRGRRELSADPFHGRRELRAAADAVRLMPSVHITEGERSILRDHFNGKRELRGAMDAVRLILAAPRGETAAIINGHSVNGKRGLGVAMDLARFAVAARRGAATVTKELSRPSIIQRASCRLSSQSCLLDGFQQLPSEEPPEMLLPSYGGIDHDQDDRSYFSSNYDDLVAGSANTQQQDDDDAAATTSGASYLAEEVEPPGLEEGMMAAGELEEYSECERHKARIPQDLCSLSAPCRPPAATVSLACHYHPSPATHPEASRVMRVRV